MPSRRMRTLRTPNDERLIRREMLLAGTLTVGTHARDRVGKIEHGAANIATHRHDRREALNAARYRVMLRARQRVESARGVGSCGRGVLRASGVREQDRERRK